MRTEAQRVMLILLFLLLCSRVDAQNSELDTAKVTIELNNESLLDLIRKIEVQSKFVFAYRPEIIASIVNLNLPKATRTIRETLDLVLSDKNLTWRQQDYNILITTKKNESHFERRIVSGTVRDKNGVELAGVSIVVKGTTLGMSADVNGQYSIPAEEDDVLIFSFIGYKTFQMSAGKRSIIDITMEEDISVLGEVVISGGYYETTDRMKTGNISKVTAKEIETQPVTSPMLALLGKVPGLDISPINGTPGTAPVIRIRGLNSLRRDGNFPLYVIDGVPVTSNQIETSSTPGDLNFGGYDPLSTINPSNIASIEVLKDGDATAIYGSRGANGVILITTKRAKAGDRTNVDLGIYSGIGHVPKKVDLLNRQQYLQMRREALENDGNPEITARWDLDTWDTTRYTDWQKELIGGSANITDVQGSISSGSKNTSFTFGGGFHKETLVTPGDFGYLRGNGNISINHTSTDKKFQASVVTNYGAEVSELFKGSFVVDAVMTAPNAPRPYNDDGTVNWEIHDNFAGKPAETWQNPMAKLLKKIEATNQNLVSNANLSYTILPGLSVSSSLGWTDLNSRNNSMEPTTSLSPTAIPDGGGSRSGVASFMNSKRTSWIVEPKINGSKQWKKHKLDVVVGTTLQQRRTIESYINTSGYSSDALLGSIKAASNILVVKELDLDYKYASLYARAGYNFKDKYLLNLTGRRDGSSRFGPGKRFANFGAVGAAWIFSEEGVIKNSLSFINFGKIRTSYGITGSDNIGDYKYYDLYEPTEGKYNQIAGYVPVALYNPDYAWEVTKKFEVGLETGFFQNRISTEVSWYQNLASQQLVDYPLPATTGFESVLKNFEATVENKGLEIVLRGDVLSSDDWQWNLSANVTLPSNMLKKFDGIENSPYINIYRVGEPLSIQYLFEYKGVNPETGYYDVADRNNDGVINDLDRYLVTIRNKKYFGGLNSSLRYRNFEFTVQLQYSNNQMPIAQYGGTPGEVSNNQPVSVLSRWQKPGDITTVQKFGVQQAFVPQSWMYQSDGNITDASFIRVRSLNISYSVPTAWIEKARIRQARIYMQGQNLFTITNYDALDPETGNSSLPPLRMFTAGLNLRF